jgi:hypothetical protein
MLLDFEPLIYLDSNGRRYMYCKHTIGVLDTYNKF